MVRSNDTSFSAHNVSTIFARKAKQQTNNREQPRWPPSFDQNFKRTARTHLVVHLLSITATTPPHVQPQIFIVVMTETRKNYAFAGGGHDPNLKTPSVNLKTPSVPPRNSRIPHLPGVGTTGHDPIFSKHPRAHPGSAEFCTESCFVHDGHDYWPISSQQPEVVVHTHRSGVCCILFFFRLS